MRYLIFLFTILFFANHTKAQDSKFSVSPTIGVNVPLLDGGFGFHLGVNPHVKLTQHLSAEAQVSYLYTSISSSFLSGYSGSINALNTLTGLRLYINPETRKTRFFLNLLAGMNYTKEKLNGIEYEGEFNFGFSTGLFVEYNRMIFGISSETPENLVLKTGFSF